MQGVWARALEGHPGLQLPWVCVQGPPSPTEPGVPRLFMAQALPLRGDKPGRGVWTWATRDETERPGNQWPTMGKCSPLANHQAPGPHLLRADRASPPGGRLVPLPTSFPTGLLPVVPFHGSWGLPWPPQRWLVLILLRGVGGA